MNFSQEVKLELAHLPMENECCMRAELAGALLSDGSLLLGGGGRLGLALASELAAIARREYLLLAKAFGEHCEIRAVRRNYPKVRNVYTLVLKGEGAKNVLLSCGAVQPDNMLSLRHNLPRKLMGRECCRRSFIRGVFLGCGSIAEPSSKYHLEFATSREAFAHSFAEYLTEEGIRAGVIRRRNTYVVYVKECDSIVTLLGMMGASSAFLKMESVRTVKEVRNRANRAYNCDNANMEKAISAGIRQSEEIRYLDEVYGIKRLSAALQEVARLRLENSGMSLEELGAMLDPPLGKSAVNHRLRRLSELAQKLREENGE